MKTEMLTNQDDQDLLSNLITEGSIDEAVTAALNAIALVEGDSNPHRWVKVFSWRVNL